MIILHQVAMAGHMHFNAAGHAWDSETTVKNKAHRVNITNASY